MPKRKRSDPLIFPGWWAVLSIGIISGLGHGLNSYGISVFFKDLVSELGLNRGVTSLATGIGRLESGFASPLAGWMADKYGPRLPIVLGICVAGTGMILMNFIVTAWQYFVVWGFLIGVGLNIGLTVPTDKALNDWFSRKKGLTQGIKFALIGVFSIIVVQVVTVLVLSYGWRTTLLIWGIIMFASVPFIFASVRKEGPEYYGMLPDGAKIGLDIEEAKDEVIDSDIKYASNLQETEYSFRQAIRTRSFWMLVIAYCISTILSVGFNLHLIPFLTDMGIKETTASNMMGMMLFFTIPSRLLGGIIADRVPKSRLHLLLAGTLLLQVIGISTFLIYQNTASIYVQLTCHGLSTGAVSPLIIVILGRYYGRKAFGSIFGTTLALLAIPGLISPVYFGWIYDIRGSYIIGFITFDVIAILATLTTCLVRPPKEPLHRKNSSGWI